MSQPMTTPAVPEQHPSAPAPTPFPVAAPLEELDINFVSAEVASSGWLAWGDPFKSLADLYDRLELKLGTDRRVRRLVIAALGTVGHTGMICFDPTLARREILDGVMRDPIRPDLAPQLKKLRRYLTLGSVVELRVAGAGAGVHGLKMLTALADLLGVPCRAPASSPEELAVSGGLVRQWLTVYPARAGLGPVTSVWRELPLSPDRPVDIAYAPVPGVAAPPLANEVAAAGVPEVDIALIAPSVTSWNADREGYDGIEQVVDDALGMLQDGQTIRRLAISAIGSTRIDGFVGFDSHNPPLESIDGALSDQADYAHLEIVEEHVRTQLERLAPHFAPDGVLEIRACRFGAGENGRRALQQIADVVGVAVRGPAASAHEITAAGGLLTRWTTAYPSVTGREPVESAWQEVINGPRPPGWIEAERAGYAPLKDAPAPPLPVARIATQPLPVFQMPEPAAPAAAVVPAPPAIAYRGEEDEPEPGVLVQKLLVRCGNCEQPLDEPPAVPVRIRRPCPKCGSVARRTELVTVKQSREPAWARLMGAIRKKDPNSPIVA